MNYIIYDVETTTSNKGAPFDRANKLVCSGLLYSNNPTPTIEYYPTQETVDRIDRDFTNGTYLVVTFNGKFDINWHRKIGGKYPTKIWDCQLAAFLLSNQKERYPSLDGELERYGFPPKLDIVKTEYWGKGKDTTEVPREILSAYLKRDLEATEQVFKQQYKLFQTTHKHLYPLFKLQCQDLIVLADMEYNGVLFNTKEARIRANEIQAQQTEIQRSITEFIGNVPYSLTSDSHISAILYGGVILEEFRIPIGVYKTGEKAGQTRYSVNYKAYEFPRLVEPLKNSQVKDKVSKKEEEFIKKGILKEPRIQYAVNEDTFKLLKPKGKAKQLMTLIMEFNKIDKLRSTYLEGWSNLIDEMNWEPDMLHSQLNQCLVVTGRLSSSKPNSQNADKNTKKFCQSRYK